MEGGLSKGSPDPFMTLQMLYSLLGRTNNEILSLALSSTTTPLRQNVSEELQVNVLTLQAKVQTHLQGTSQTVTSPDYQK